MCANNIKKLELFKNKNSKTEQSLKTRLKKYIAGKKEKSYVKNQTAYKFLLEFIFIYLFSERKNDYWSLSLGDR